MRKFNGIQAMIIFRILYILLIIVCFGLKRYDYAILNIGVFFATGILPLLAKKDERYGWLDAYTISVFVIFIGLLVATNDAIIADAGLFGIDKFFHAAGGAALAWFFMLFFENQVSKHTRALYVILGVVAIGVGWEFFEIALALLPDSVALEYHGLLDSFIDLVADVLGGAIAASIMHFRLNRDRE